jgi:RNA polymerase sigma factor (sigma-70 family)
VVQDKTDSELVEFSRLGDKEAFDCLIRRYEVLAKNIAKGMLHNPEVAHELVQEAFLQAYLSLDRLQNSASFKSWLYGIVLNVCRGYLRQQQHQPRLLSLESMLEQSQSDGSAGSLDLDPLVVAEAHELHQVVLKAIEVLSPKLRTATLLFYFEQLSVQEIAALLKISSVAVKGRLHKGRLQLKEQLLQLYTEMGYTNKKMAPVPAPMRVSALTPIPAPLPVQMSEADYRSNHMIKMTIADIREHHDHCVITLIDEAGQQIVPIWVGRPEAEIIGLGIAMSVGKFSSPRPMTMNFMLKLLDSTGAQFEEARVAALRDDVFYGIAKVKTNQQSLEIDCRPSDAIAMAVYSDAPIYVAEEVVAKAGHAVPADAPSKLQTDGYKLKIQQLEVPVVTPPVSSLEITKQARQDLLAALFESHRSET